MNLISNVHSHETTDEVLGKSWDRSSRDVSSSTRQSSNQSSSSSSPSLNHRRDKPIRVSDEFSFTWIGQRSVHQNPQNKLAVHSLLTYIFSFLLKLLVPVMFNSKVYVS